MLASTSVQLWDALRHSGLAGALWHAGQHISTPHQSKRQVDHCKVSLDCSKWELINASKAKQTSTMEVVVKGKKYQGAEYLWGKYCISLSFIAWEKLQYTVTPQKTSQETTAILQLSFFPLVFGVSTYK